MLAWALFGSAAGNSQAQVASVASAPPLAPQATPGQDFQDVIPVRPSTLTCTTFTRAGMVSGYTCQPGGPNDPCVPPDNLPYYHPGSRRQPPANDQVH